MARFRRKARSSRGFRGFSRGRRSTNNSVSVEKMAIGGALYGAARPFIANVVPNVTALGEYSDNVILGGLGYLAAKKGSGMIKSAGLVMLANEAFIAGSKVTTANSTPTGNTTGSW